MLFRSHSLRSSLGKDYEPWLGEGLEDRIDLIASLPFALERDVMYTLPLRRYRILATIYNYRISIISSADGENRECLNSSQ